MSKLTDFEAELKSRIVGQDEALSKVAKRVMVAQAGLSRPGRPRGTFLFLGYTGVGKTHTVEAVAELLHGDPQSMIRVDCGEFQLEHDVAKIVGAPPGYIGHREGEPFITSSKLRRVESSKCDISVVLFDEIEKSALSLRRILLGILGSAVMRLSDNTLVNFERSLIFMTSNLGASEIQGALQGGPGFQSAGDRPSWEADAVQRIATRTLKKAFAPEFINRIDEVVVYEPLDTYSIERILDIELDRLREHLFNRLEENAPVLKVTLGAREKLVAAGVSKESGARELNRVIDRVILQPLGALVVDERIPAGGEVILRLDDMGEFDLYVGESAMDIMLRAATKRKR